MKNKSFTLIELLVVIALISLLASIVLIALKDARERARIAKALQWSQSIHSLLGSNCVGWWNFDDGSSITASDASGNGNDGTINGAAPTNDTPNNVLGKALSFNGAGDYVEVSYNLLNTLPVSVEAWFRTPTLNERRVSIVSNDNPGHYGHDLGISSNNTIEVGFHNGFRVIPSPTLSANTWYHVVAVWSGTVGGSGNVRVYVNGELVDSYDYSQQVLDGRTVVDIGRHNPSVPMCFDGFIDEVRIYKEALPEQAIREHYLAGLEKHQNLAKR